jgi:hypothetical protein
MDYINLLKYGFLVIFFATAVLGIASIPGWIVIPEWYRKRIFVALILEVVGAIIILFRQELISDEARGIPKVVVSHEDWAALKEDGSFVSPQVKVTTSDTTFIVAIGSESWKELDNLHAQISKNGLSVNTEGGLTLGVIPSSDIEQAGLFNSFKTAKNEITSTENYSYIKWEKKDDGSWQRKGSFIKPFELEVYDDPMGTFYRLLNTSDQSSIFDSKSNAKDLIDEDNRIVHFLEHQNIYYLLRISWADLGKKQKTKYVHVINVKMQPSFTTANQVNVEPKPAN